MLTNCSVTYHGPFCMILDSVRYLRTSGRRSTEPFIKRLSHCRGKWTFIFVFFALCSPTAQSRTMVCFVWPWTHSNTFRLREDAPQNRWQNGLALEEVSKLVVSCFLPYSRQLLSHVVWSVLLNIELSQILPHFVEMLHKNVYEMVQPLWRYVNFYFWLFALMLTNCSVPYCGAFGMSVCSVGYLHTASSPSLLR